MPSHNRTRRFAFAGDADIAGAAAIFADPARAAILVTLLDGRPHAVTELALRAGIAVSTASGHVARLRGEGFIETQRKGRVQAVRLVRDDVVHACEALARIAKRIPVTSLRGDEQRRSLEGARLCYDHLAGELGVRVFESLVRERALRAVSVPDAARKVHAGLGDVALGARAVRVFESLEIDLAEVARSQRRFATACLDWTHERPHLAGALGSSLREVFERRNWIERLRETRALRITPAGHAALARHFGISSIS